MVTGALKGKVDAVGNAFWSGGIANPIEVIEQITYLLFIRRLDELQQLAENRARLTGEPLSNVVFGEGLSSPPGRTPRPLSDLRWSLFKNLDPATMFEVVDGHVFPFIRALGDEGSSFARNMKDARFTIPTPALLAKVVDLLEAIPMDDTDAKGDIYEYMLGKLATSGTNGQFRTPRHIIKLMVDMTAPKPGDRIVDPAAGTAGFLTVASEYLREHHPEIWADAAKRDHFNRLAFSGFDSDATMSRIGSMNLLLHGVEAATVERRDSLAEGVGADDGEYTLVLANPPFAGSVDAESIATDLTRMVKTKKTELLFLALMLRLMKNGARAAVIVPDGVLFGSSTAHKALRRMLVDDHKLDAVVKLPSGVFKPYAGVSTAILFFTKTSSGGTDHVWFYDVQSDGFSLDDKRTALASSDLPDVLARWQTLTDAGSPEADRPRTAQSFLVARQEIVDAGYDLSLNRYKEVEHEEVKHRDPLEIIAELQALEAEIAAATAALAESLRSQR
ncbi:type I restriction-modification system subunit M [Microcella frigidaquae]|uniref:site-specific DNA-methyltransferase (adenine-specific) n=1 Tax=Microcella frigidaquae TaxID=424758 RepID=A0A840X7A4_9MICO|nr:class I SAM-dependent DNA methyltransferase [Microcella frigidaquae]MBB5617035.1 type I restriction enzyme M protein [Microcella frigidaquae]NHN45240.1 SAM-dependent DNA methyltransferase [Microcella frigidaquae]